MHILIYILGWYTCSITLSLYNKWMFDPLKGLQIPFPIFITSFHQLLLWILSYLYIKIKNEPNSNMNIFNKEKKIYYMKYIIPTAIVSSGDIGFGNVSFKFIPLTIYTIVKSSSIAFVLFFGCIFKIEKFHWKLLLIVCLMFVGVSIMVYKPHSMVTNHSESKEILGFFMVLISSLLNGLRWVFTQLILKQGNSTDVNNSSIQKKNPIYTIYHLAPIMGFTLLLTTFIVEKPFPEILKTSLFNWKNHSNLLIFFRSISLLAFPGFTVFLMTICEFAILQKAHVLTMSIAGIIKELLTIIVSLAILKETLDVYNLIGMSLILLDVCYYNYYRYVESVNTYQTYYSIDNEMDFLWELDRIDESNSSQHLSPSS